MDTKNPSSSNLPADQPSDLSFQVMPTGDGPSEIREPLPPATPPLVPPIVKKPPIAPLPPKPEHELPEEPESSRPSDRLIYIIVGVVVLIILAALAYFMLGSKKTTAPAQETPTTKLPKVWLQQYFNKEVCDDQNTCGDDMDPDSDGLKNYDEFKAGVSPINPDTDSDGIADGDEVNIYKTEPTLKYTDRRDIVAQNDWTDGVQIKNNYDPLTPGLKFTDIRKQQIADDTTKYSLHEPTITTLAASSNQTADWKTYTNSQNKYEFMHPQNLVIRQFSEAGNDEPISSSAISVGLKQGTDFIFTVKFPGITTLSDQTITQQFTASKTTDYTITTDFVAGVSAFKVVFNQNVNGIVSDFYFIQTNSKVYELTITKNNTMATQILSTFKFTN